MRWSVKIATIFGIPIKVHVTFLVLLAVIAAIPVGRGEGLAGLMGVTIVLLVFACVLLHELGHSLVAQWYGVKVDSITLLPIGGIAAMRTLPRSPGPEFVIALAGPVVSVTLAAAFGAIGYLRYGPEMFVMISGQAAYARLDIITNLALINTALAAFNLLPAFPMDGGRMLRAVLWSRLGFARATRTASNIGQGLAIALFALALLNGRSLLVVMRKVAPLSGGLLLPISRPATPCSRMWNSSRPPRRSSRYRSGQPARAGTRSPSTKTANFWEY